ncbi:MAG: S8 family peptidase, partial [Chloroflexi bacterium]|nr:S8 family peptidase [Chloroflexota bacterium]
WVSPDATVAQSDVNISTANLLDSYISAIGANSLWNDANALQGQGVTVAIVDSGISLHPDLSDIPWSHSWRVLATADFSSERWDLGLDGYGHGTHVAGIVGGNGLFSRGVRMGVAPRVNLVNVRVCDNKGKGMTSDVVAGLQWIYENRDRYNIRVVNLSLNSSVPESYHTSPLAAALEVLWFNGVVVVVSAGNNGSGEENGILYPPANDPFVITVGATDDRGTTDPTDDVLAPFSAYGVTLDGHAKPDLVAPGTNVVSLLANRFCTVSAMHPSHRVAGFNGADRYFRMSGTSMASAVTAGAAALLLQQEPGLTPDQVKYRLMATARPLEGNPAGAGAGCLDIQAAVSNQTKESANTGLEASRLLWSGNDPIAWDSVNWNSVNWNSVNWNSVNWNSVNWNSVNWNSVIWDD